MHLQSLFTAPIVEQKYLDPGYSGHANDVWRITTTNEVVIVRSPRPEKLDGPFWKGCSFLFGLDPGNIFDLEQINAALSSLSTIPIPQIQRKGIAANRPYVIVEHMPGKLLTNFAMLPDETLEYLGQALAHIHTRRFNYYGHPTGRQRFALSTFHERVSKTMELLVSQFYQGDAQIRNALATFFATALHMPPPEDAALIMIDIDSTQFLTDGQHLTALVDTEAYAVGPRELDFIALEYILDQRTAAAFIKGYMALLPLPDLTLVRPLYRYLYRLFGIQGSTDLTTWMKQPVLFEKP